jgi:L-asparaginase
MERPPRVVLVSTGGTIASRSSGPGAGYDPALGGTALLASVPGWESLARVDVREFSLKPSYALDVDDVVALAEFLRGALAADDVRAAVLTIGTAAMEEVGYLLDLMLDGGKPVVLVGAMLHASRPGHDGPRNLLDGLRVAVDAGAAGRGVLVCMAGEVHAAREVQKLHKTSVAAFGSWPSGPLALADADRIVWLRQPRGRWTFGPVRPLGPVDIVPASLGCDDRQLRGAMATGARGVVVVGLPGGGGVPPPMMAAIRDALAAGLPVVATSRSPLGRTLPAAGGGTGPRDMAEAGAILCGDLPPAKARLLLMCALGSGCDREGLRRIFAHVAP